MLCKQQRLQFPFLYDSVIWCFLHLLCFWDSSLKRARGAEWHWVLCGWGLMGRLWLIGGECLNYYGEAVSFSWWFRETSVSINNSSVVVLINPSYWTGTISCLFYLKAYLGKCFLNKSLRSVWFLMICPVFAVHVQIQLSDFLVSFLAKIVIESKSAGTLS